MDARIKIMVEQRVITFQEAWKMDGFGVPATPLGVWRAKTNNFGAANSDITNDNDETKELREQIENLEQKLEKRRR